MQLGPSNITVNAICPNLLENPSYYPPEICDEANKDRLANYLLTTPLGRLGTAKVRSG